MKVILSGHIAKKIIQGKESDIDEKSEAIFFFAEKLKMRYLQRSILSFIPILILAS